MSDSKSAEKKCLHYAYTVYQLLSTPKWEVRITPSFVPDEVVVRQVTYHSVDNDGAWVLTSDMIVGDGIIASLACAAGQFSATPGTRFKVKTAPGDVITFSVREIAAGPVLRDPQGALNGTFLMQLEFVKYT
jgi:hypothetical protein